MKYPIDNHALKSIKILIADKTQQFRLRPGPHGSEDPSIEEYSALRELVRVYESRWPELKCLTDEETKDFKAVKVSAFRDYFKSYIPRLFEIQLNWPFDPEDPEDLEYLWGDYTQDLYDECKGDYDLFWALLEQEQLT